MDLSGRASITQEIIERQGGENQEYNLVDDPRVSVHPVANLREERLSPFTERKQGN